MARVETGHIHLGSSILHHTEGPGNKESKKTAGRNTQKHKDSYKHTCTYACTQTPTANKEKELHRSDCPFEKRKKKKHMQPCSLQDEKLKNRNHILYITRNPTKILQADTHTDT